MSAEPLMIPVPLVLVSVVDGISRAVFSGLPQIAGEVSHGAGLGEV